MSAPLQVALVHAAPLNVGFGTKPVTLDQWVVCLAMGSSVLWAAEARKWFLRGQISSLPPRCRRLTRGLLSLR